MNFIPADCQALDLTELWWDSEKQNLLTVNGFSGTGSHYECFRNLCTCFARMPDAPETNRSREQLREWFGCTLTVNPETAGVIWRQTSDFLLKNPVCRQDLSPVSPNQSNRTGAIKDYLIFSDPVGREIRVDTLHFQEKNWKLWSASAIAFLTAAVQTPGTLFSLTLADDFLPQKPTLYHVERILTETEPNRNRWLTQMTYFLFLFCEQYNTRLLLRTSCHTDTMCDLISMLSRMTGVPNLIWKPERAVADEELCTVSRAVMNGRRKPNDGVAPMLLL